ncbi:MAG: cbb3-type cytochrome c oxidase subunit 3 [Acetobacteraceae bacterium]|jgi:cytochrome c oxidase cbb3-type subunit 4|nr:cbb3-type cytochrome c oxidase subunit 3 [Acetobacteraceae bacterium]
MQSLVELYPALRALWVVWFFVLFLGMVWFVMRPSRRKHFESLGDTPLRDDRAPPRS